MRIFCTEPARLIVLVSLLCGVVRAEDDQRPLAGALPADALAFVQLDHPSEWLASAFESPTWNKLLDSKGYAALRQSDGWPKALLAWRAFERILGAEGPAALERLFGGGLAVALYPPGEGRGEPHLVAILESPDDEIPGTLLDSASVILRLAGWLGQGAGPLWVDADGGDRYLKVGDTYFQARGSKLVVSTSEARLKAVTEHLTGKRGSLATDRHYLERVKLRPEESIASLLVYTGRLSEAGRLIPERLDEPLVSLLLGGLLEAGARSDVLSFDVIATRTDLEIRGRVPLPPSKLSESQRAAFATESGARPRLEEPEHAILGLRVRRDLASWWANRGELLDESVQRGFIEFSNIMSLLFAGKDFAREVLPDFGSEWELWLTRPMYEAGALKPSPLYPAGYLTVPVLRPDAMRNVLRGAFQTAIGITNAQRAQEGLSGLMLETDEIAGTNVQWAELLPESIPEVGHLPALYNLSPATALHHDRFVLSSSASLLESFVQRNRVSGALEPQPWFELSLWSGPLVELLRENREALVANAVLNEGKEESVAERDVDILFELTGLLERLELRAEPKEPGW
ncbi:MAG: hypothetical protein RL885_19065, partial [Planctomycetota bacterium]